MSRKYSPREILIISQMCREMKITVNAEMLKRLQDGEGTIKDEYAADKAITHYNSFISKPPSRQEAMERFVTKQLYQQEISEVNIAAITAQRLLVKKGLVTQEEIEFMRNTVIAETLDDKCTHCKFITFAECEGFPQFAGEVFPGLEVPLTDRVVECPYFKVPEQEGNA